MNEPYKCSNIYVYMLLKKLREQLKLYFWCDLNSALDSTDYSYIILFSKGYTMHASKDFQVEYFIQDPMYDVSVPLMFLRSIFEGEV